MVLSGVPAAPRARLRRDSGSWWRWYFSSKARSIGTFLSLDLIVFFVFFELVLIPMWFVIADWGDAHDPVGRRRAATRFLVVTVTGSALMLVAFLLLHHATGTFDIPTILRVGGQIPYRTQLAVAVLLMLGFGAKVPMWPLHFWLPDAHSKAPTVGSVLLAGVLLKLGTYGLLRFWAGAIPDGALTVSPYLGALGVVGILYGALACLAQRDVKRLVAYSSVGHMGFVLLAISTLTRQGVLAANFANIAHALVTGLLFFVVGAVKDRTGGTDFDDGRARALRARAEAGRRVRLRGGGEPRAAGTGRVLGRDAGHAVGVLAGLRAAAVDVPDPDGAGGAGRGADHGLLRAGGASHLPGRPRAAVGRRRRERRVGGVGRRWVR